MSARMSLKVLGQGSLASEEQSAASGKSASSSQVSSGVSRRSFLKILGAASAAGAVGCADSNAQKIFPNLKGEQEQIPGVAVWYSSTCTECSAGCGIQVRTREGRAVKVEGNPDSPINRGGLCALGQSSLQNLYDPDRVRQPMQRGADGSFSPISWDEAYTRIADALKEKDRKKVFISGESSGAIDDLLNSFSKSFSVDRVAFDMTQQPAVAKASELVYGVFGVPTYNFEKAEVILNFGADFLETFVSPVQYARGWSVARRATKPARFVHIEPRLSLTGANSDLWLKNAPASEIKIALVILKDLLESGKGEGLRDDIRQKLIALVAKVDAEKYCAEAGVALEKVLSTAHYLKNAKVSLVLAGGAAASTMEPLSLQVVVNFINLILGNVGETVNLAALRKPKTSATALAALTSSMAKGDYGLVFVHGTNPLFTFPSGLGLDVALKTAPLVVSFSSHLDETAALAHLILPSNTSLETWGDVRAVSGVYSLLQPTMSAVFDTRSLGDIVLQISAKAGNSAVADELLKGESKQDFQAYLKASWKKLHASLGVSTDFNQFWLESLERGGYFEAANSSERPKVKVDSKALELVSEAVPSFKPAFGTEFGSDELHLYPFPSVRSFDGRAANRPWLHEVPDPITQIAWDSWAELHPSTAKARGIELGDFVTVRNHFGEVNLPAFITEQVHPGIVAIPIGNGHSQYGRFARKVSGGNVLGLLPDELPKLGDSVALLSAAVKVSRGVGKSELVITQGSDSQLGRELARTSFIGVNVGSSHGSPALLPAFAGAAAEHAPKESHGAHAEPKQMYVQRKHPLYDWALSVDLTACTGCSACVVACYAENNIPVVGKKVMYQGREMAWLRIERYFGEGKSESEEFSVNFLPMMCQQCHNAPCEPVCPVYATYHNEEGLNAMVYNRCVGTRYCSNNCSYKVRRFNWFEYDLPEPLTWQLNPDVTKRGVGVMEKCTFCIQRITEGKDKAKDEGRVVRDGEIQPACVQSCPTQALSFGNLNDPQSRVNKQRHDERAYKVLDHHINTQPAVTYLERVKYKA